MSKIDFPSNPGRVVIGLGKNDAGQVVAYAYYGEQRTRLEYPYDPLTGHVLWLVGHVADAAQAAGAEAVLYSSTVDFWEEAIA